MHPTGKGRLWIQNQRQHEGLADVLASWRRHTRVNPFVVVGHVHRCQSEDRDHVLAARFQLHQLRDAEPEHGPEKRLVGPEPVPLAVAFDELLLDLADLCSDDDSVSRFLFRHLTPEEMPADAPMRSGDHA